MVCVSTASNAAAPPGGCRQRAKNIRPMAPPTATAAARAGSGIQLALAMPTTADSVLPPITDQGCASGLAGTANTSTALAPSGAISQTAPPSEPASQRHSTAVTNSPRAAPPTARSRSRALTLEGPGSQARR
ncbi:hypothetical protein FQZ97_685700 [compost metagenome]